MFSRYIAVVGWNPSITLFLDETAVIRSDLNHEIEQYSLPPWRHDGPIVAGHSEDICSMTVSRHSNLLVTADFSGEICVWNAVSGHILKRLEEVPDTHGEYRVTTVFIRFPR